MDPKSTRLRHQEQTALAASQTPTGHDFQSVEEMLRHDEAGIHVPPAVTDRLSESIAREPARRVSWWRRLLGHR